jgi:transposase IS66 family protein
MGQQRKTGRVRPKVFMRRVHPEAHLASWAGLMQADAYAGFNRLYEPARKPGPIVEAACWAPRSSPIESRTSCG